MLLDLFKQKQNSQEQAPRQIPTPATQQAAQPAATQPAPAPTPTQPLAKPNPAPVAQPNPQAAPRTAVQTQPNTAQPMRSAAHPPQAQQGFSQVPRQPNLNVDDIYPVLLRKIKEDFKGVTGEAEKLRDIDARLKKVSKTFEDFQKFMDDSKSKINEMKNKTDNFDVALYELVTNQFNPFIKQDPRVAKPTLQTSAQQEAPLGVPQDISTLEPVTASPLESGSSDPYEEELRKALAETGDDDSAPGKDMKQIVVEDDISKNQEAVGVPVPSADQENAFMEGASKLTPGVKQGEPESDDRKLIRERIQVEDVLNVPKKGSPSDEVSETLSFKETWNDPSAKDLEQSPPKLKRMDLKDLLHKFMSKHEQTEHQTKLEEQRKAELKMQDAPSQTPLAPVEVQHEHKKPEQHHSSKHHDHKKDDEKMHTWHIEKERVASLKITDPKEYFWFQNGKVAKSLQDLSKELKNMNDQVFSEHVSSTKNDFANWVRGVLKSESIANKIQKCNNRQAMIHALH